MDDTNMLNYSLIPLYSDRMWEKQRNEMNTSHSSGICSTLRLVIIKALTLFEVHAKQSTLQRHVRFMTTKNDGPGSF